MKKYFSKFMFLMLLILFTGVGCIIGWYGKELYDIKKIEYVDSLLGVQGNVFSHLWKWSKDHSNKVPENITDTGLPNNLPLLYDPSAWAKPTKILFSSENQNSYPLVAITFGDGRQYLAFRKALKWQDEVLERLRKEEESSHD